MVRVARGFPLQRKRTHARATIAFTGASGLGLVDVAVPVFTITGRVLVHAMTVFCTETLEGATATIALGTTTGASNHIGATTATSIAANDWWIDTTPLEIGTAQIPSSMRDMVLSEDVIITPATATVTNGTLVIDVFYEPITDNGSLV